MRTLRVALAQINTVVGDLTGNVERILAVYGPCSRSAGADVVAFPEMAITGYPAEDLLFRSAFLRDNVKAMHQVVAKSQGLTAVVGYAHVEDGQVYNAAAIAHDGRLVDVYRKHHLPTYGVFDEDRYFQSGRVFPVYTIGGINVG